MQPPRWPLKREPTEQDRAFPGYRSAPTEVQLTAEGLWRLTDAHGRRPLVPVDLTVELHSAGWLWAPPTFEEAVERVVLHVLTLEDCGFLSTYVAEGAEWISLHRPLPALAAPSAPAPGPQPASGTPGFAGFDSTALERERENARARARERASAIENANAAHWATLRTVTPRTPPEIPLEMLAPPIGCPDHPHGNVTSECGPCGTAREFRREFFAKARYERQLADDEFWRTAEGQGDDTPF